MIIILIIIDWFVNIKKDLFLKFYVYFAKFYANIHWLYTWTILGL